MPPPVHADCGVYGLRAQHGALPNSHGLRHNLAILSRRVQRRKSAVVRVLPPIVRSAAVAAASAASTAGITGATVHLHC